LQKNTRESRPVLIDIARSPEAKLTAVPLDSIDVTDDPIWGERLNRNRTVTLRRQYQKLVDQGYLENFRSIAEDLDQLTAGLAFRDSDLYKWLEAACWTLVDETDQELTDKVETVIDLIKRAQEDDGYLNTYFVRERAHERWSNLRDLHELYCAGHLFQAAIAHYRATQKTDLLDVAVRFADLIVETFGPGDDQIQGVPGHPEIEMALIELGRTTGDKKYLDQAAYFIQARGRGLIGGRPYHQDHRPVADWDRLTGHAVRALYLSAAATDWMAEEEKPDVHDALNRVWQRMTTRQVYVTGGIGARHSGESVGADYELPNARAYAETCAGIANVMWNWRMLNLEGRPQYADMIETALYNAVLPGLSLDGARYFYVNPLAVDDLTPGDVRERQEWYRCACCPPNLARTLSKLRGYMTSLDRDETLWIHLYATHSAEIQRSNGDTFKYLMRTRYPWSGHITLEILTPGLLALKLRVPGWCTSQGRVKPEIRINGNPRPGPVTPGQYVKIRRTWAVGDSICLDLPMPVRTIASHPYALENTGRVALMRGPLLYCLEGVDHPDVDLRDVVVPVDSQAYSSIFEPDLLEGVQVIQTEAKIQPPAPAWTDNLYRPVPSDEGAAQPEQTMKIIAIPYFAWGNRETGTMQVWLRHQI
jgi:uncharacterized protein